MRIAALGVVSAPPGKGCGPAGLCAGVRNSARAARVSLSLNPCRAGSAKFGLFEVAAHWAARRSQLEYGFVRQILPIKQAVVCFFEAFLHPFRNVAAGRDFHW